jgi:cytochrome c peroxidase
VLGRAFEYDASQGGTTFSDPDGDTLTYDLILDTRFPRGLSFDGTWIRGIASEIGGVGVTIRATDPNGQTNRNSFVIGIRANAPPVPSPPIPDKLVTVGEFVDVDVYGKFVDPNGDPVTYSLRFPYATHGLSVSGNRVVGVFNAIGAVVVEVVATDHEGAAGTDMFTIAAPAAEPGRPTLPDPPYKYADSGLALPGILTQIGDHVPYDTNYSNGWDELNVTDDRVAPLGRVLFYDRRLSITNTHACASCHRQELGFTVAERFGTGIQGLPTRRNPMALGNVRFNFRNRFFSDDRSQTLEATMLLPIQDPLELGMSLDLLVAKLSATDFYPELFTQAFGTPGVTSERIALALAQFLRSMIQYRSKFDLAMHPMDEDVHPNPEFIFTVQELRGQFLFDGLSCDLCHVRFTQIAGASNNGLDVNPVDPGAGDGEFRPSSLRNVGVTAPYMHDGRFSTLRQVIDHYDHGVQDSANLDTTFREPGPGLGAPRRLNLSEADKQALEAFLHTFTDHEFLSEPKFSDPFR